MLVCVENMMYKNVFLKEVLEQMKTGKTIFLDSTVKEKNYIVN